MDGIAERAQDCRNAIGNVEGLVRRGRVAAALAALGPLWGELDRLRDELASAGRAAPGYNELRDRSGAGGVSDVNPDALDTIEGGDVFTTMQLEQSLRMARDGLAALCAVAGMPEPEPELPGVGTRRTSPSVVMTVVVIAVILLLIALIAPKR